MKCVLYEQVFNYLIFNNYFRKYVTFGTKKNVKISLLTAYFHKLHLLLSENIYLQRQMVKCVIYDILFGNSYN